MRTDGRPVGIGAGLLRLIGYLVSILLLGLPFLWVLVDNRRQGIHDKLARTCVVYAWDAEPAVLRETTGVA